MTSPELEPGQEPGPTVIPPHWRSYLEQRGGRFEGDRVSGFGPGDLTPGSVPDSDLVVDLSHFGLIAVDGPDASKFLASLFTGDVRLVSPDQGQFTSWCDGKGRMLATFWLFMRGDTYFLLLPAELLPSILSRLLQFRLRSKVTISDAGSTLARAGFSGPGLAVRLAEALAAPVPMARGETATIGECTLMFVDAVPAPRWLAIGSAAALQSVWEKLVPPAVPAGSTAWSLLHVLSGIPLLGLETTGEFVPQMVNLEALGGLSFTKGCYPGQEVVARLHYRGQLKRRLYLATVDSEQVPPAGTRLYAPGSSESAGMVVSAAPCGPGRIALLAVVVIEQKALGEIRLADLQGPLLGFAEPDADLALNV